MRLSGSALVACALCGCGIVADGADAESAPSPSGHTVALAVRDGNATYLLTVGRDGVVGRLPLRNVNSLEMSRSSSDGENWSWERLLWNSNGQALAHMQVKDAMTSVTIRDAQSWSEERTLTEPNVYDFPPDLRWLGPDHLFVLWEVGQWSFLNLDAEVIASEGAENPQSWFNACSAVAPAEGGYSWVRADGGVVSITNQADGFAFVSHGTRLIVQATEPLTSPRDDIWFIHSPYDGVPVPYIDWAEMLPDGKSVVLRILRSNDSTHADYVVAQWGEEVILSNPTDSRGTQVILSLPGNERHQWFAFGDQFWGLPYEPPGNTAKILKILSTPDDEAPHVQEFAVIPTEPNHRLLVGHLFLARLDESEQGFWNYLDLRLSQPEWVELPYTGQLAYRVGVRGAIFFESMSDDWMTEPCMGCRYEAVEDLMDPDSRRLSGEVSGIDLPALANPVTGWVRAAPDGSGIVTGMGNELMLIRFGEAETPRKLSSIDAPGAFSMPWYWSSGTENDERLLKCF